MRYAAAAVFAIVSGSVPGILAQGLPVSSGLLGIPALAPDGTPACVVLLPGAPGNPGTLRFPGCVLSKAAKGQPLFVEPGLETCVLGKALVGFASAKAAGLAGLKPINGTCVVVLTPPDVETSATSATGESGDEPVPEDGAYRCPKVLSEFYDYPVTGLPGGGPGSAPRTLAEFYDYPVTSLPGGVPSIGDGQPAKRRIVISEFYDYPVTSLPGEGPVTTDGQLGKRRIVLSEFYDYPVT